MINFDGVTKEETKEHNPLIIHPIYGGSGSGKTNALLYLINHDQILIKFSYMLRIHMKKNINY